MEKRGLSGIVTAVVMIGLVMVLTTIVWVSVNNLIQDQTSTAGSCLNIFEDVALEGRFSCYDSTSGSEFVQFSVKLGAIDVDEVLISVSSNAGGKSVRISNDVQTITGLTNYDDTDSVSLPSQDGGKTYKLDWSDQSEVPNLIQIAPVIDGKQCEVSDSLQGIESCALLPS